MVAKGSIRRRRKIVMAVRQTDLLPLVLITDLHYYLGADVKRFV